MANIDYNKVASDAKDVFSLIAGLRDVGRQIRTLAIEMGVEGADMEDSLPLTDLPAAMTEKWEQMAGDKESLETMLDESLPQLENEAAAMNGILKKPLADVKKVSLHGAEPFVINDGTTIFLTPVKPDMSVAEYNSEQYIDYTFRTDEVMFLKSIDVIVANIGWGDGCIDAIMETDSDEWFAEGLTPERTDREAPNRFRMTIDGGYLRLEPGDHTLSVYYYSRNVQTVDRTMGFGMASFNLERYIS